MIRAEVTAVLRNAVLPKSFSAIREPVWISEPSIDPESVTASSESKMQLSSIRSPKLAEKDAFPAERFLASTLPASLYAETSDSIRSDGTYSLT